MQPALSLSPPRPAFLGQTLSKARPAAAPVVLQRGDAASQGAWQGPRLRPDHHVPRVDGTSNMLPAGLGRQRLSAGGTCHRGPWLVLRLGREVSQNPWKTQAGQRIQLIRDRRGAAATTQASAGSRPGSGTPNEGCAEGPWRGAQTEKGMNAGFQDTRGAGALGTFPHPEGKQTDNQ